MSNFVQHRAIKLYVLGLFIGIFVHNTMDTSFQLYV
jgi:hypothetical protein